jgi:hypothetical protein
MCHISKKRFIKVKHKKSKIQATLTKMTWRILPSVVMEYTEVWIKCIDCKLWAHELTTVPELFA